MKFSDIGIRELTLKEKFYAESGESHYFMRDTISIIESIKYVYKYTCQETKQNLHQN